MFNVCVDISAYMYVHTTKFCCYTLQCTYMYMYTCVLCSETSSRDSIGSESKLEPTKEEKTVEDKKEEEEEERESRTEVSSDVRVHVEVLVSSVGLVLYSHVGGVAEVKVKG